MLRISLVAVCSLWLAGATTMMAAAQTEQVLGAQRRLEALGLSPGPIDGLMGSQTRDALRAFQQKNALPVTGDLDWETQMALAATVRKMRDARPAPVPPAVPVPAVSMSPLAPPGARQADAEPAEPATPPVVTAETPAPAPASPGSETLLPAAAAAPDDSYTSVRTGLLAGLSAIVAGAGVALVGWVRWWSRPAKSATPPD